VIAAIAPHDSVERFEGLGVEVIRADASLHRAAHDPRRERRIEARRVIIATGSSPTVPKIDGLDGVSHFTNETIFTNQTLPEHLLILGGGPIGIEMAQAHRRLGSKVTVFENSKPMAHDDRELADRLLGLLAAEGVVVRGNTRVEVCGRAAGDWWSP
jgi:pyruvate/2-oxoglutarate dehydrogenase complex dihydrolipoamide dehydrogenase (E3) component